VLTVDLCVFTSVKPHLGSKEVPGDSGESGTGWVLEWEVSPQLPWGGLVFQRLVTGGHVQAPPWNQGGVYQACPFYPEWVLGTISGNLTW
jgi:hypothetical protein